MVIMAQSAGNWRNTHTHVDRTHKHAAHTLTATHWTETFLGCSLSRVTKCTIWTERKHFWNGPCIVWPKAPYEQRHFLGCSLSRKTKCTIWTEQRQSFSWMPMVHVSYDQRHPMNWTETFSWMVHVLYDQRHPMNWTETYYWKVHVLIWPTAPCELNWDIFLDGPYYLVWPNAPYDLNWDIFLDVPCLVWPKAPYDLRQFLRCSMSVWPKAPYDLNWDIIFFITNNILLLLLLLIIIVISIIIIKIILWWWLLLSLCAVQRAQTGLHGMTLRASRASRLHESLGALFRPPLGLHIA